MIDNLFFFSVLITSHCLLSLVVYKEKSAVNLLKIFPAHELLLSSCFQHSCSVSDVHWFDYDVSRHGSLSSSYLELVEPLGCVDSCFSSNYLFKYSDSLSLLSFLDACHAHNVMLDVMP